MTKLITQYNKLIEQIVEKFVMRYHLEFDQEYVFDKSDYDIHNYVGINTGIIDIGGDYFDIDSILIAELYQIPAQIIQDWYYERIDEKTDLNLYNYFRKVTNPALYKKGVVT